MNQQTKYNSREELLARRVIGLAMKIHRVLGSGFLESVYANALTHELRKNDISFERERKITVTYDSENVGDFAADFVLEGIIIVELKAVESLAVSHSLQLVNYLTATKYDLGLLLNFGTKSLQFKTKTRFYERSDFVISTLPLDGNVPPQFGNPVNSVQNVP